MYYEAYRSGSRGKRAGRKRRASHGGGCLGFLLRFLLKLLAVLLIFAILAAGILYALPVSLFNIEPVNTDLSLTDGLPGNRINLLLLGLDVLNEGSQRSDTLLIASIGYNSVHLTSILRDTLVEIPGHGRQKINAAYAYGGADMTMRVVNETFNLNITNYICVDFVSLVKLIDAVGGVDLEISDAELEQMNINVRKSTRVFKPLGYEAKPMTQSGKVHLDGLFALGYARIRAIDSDYNRTSRQRNVINALLRSIKEHCYNPLMWVRLSKVMTSALYTNMNVFELISIGEKAILCGNIQTYRVPDNAYLNDNGSSIEITNPEANIQSLHEFIYN